ncbi:copper amine oxidase N-terminal domain-containing protein [Rossellomorea sp. NPDC077527]|uniref:copper amine oxidase N-terminal domain-containing protein n=1 Tax=Rossellomorea sp. NPDC077527 TaxID=3364510 RepID=UPI0037CCA1D7
MKRKLLWLCSVLVLVGLFSSGNQASAAHNQVKELDGGLIHNGRTLIPMRSLFEALGVDVKWDQTTKTVTAIKSGKVIKLKANSKQATVNGKNNNLDVPTKIINSKTMVPVRFVSETLGANVKWDQGSSTVSVEAHDLIVLIKVVAPNEELSKSEITNIIKKAEAELRVIFTRDTDKYFSHTLNDSVRIKSKQQAMNYYTSNFIKNYWTEIYRSFETELWFLPYSYKDETDYYIKAQTPNKIVIDFLLYGEMNGEQYLEYKLIKKDNKWLIESFNYFVTINQAKSDVKQKLFGYNQISDSIMFMYDGENESLEEMANRNSYTIHVFQDAPDFVRTIGFYDVDKRTGKITSYY